MQSPKEVPIVIEYNSCKLHGIFHSNFDISNDTVFMFVQGLFGDRCDSRAMFTELARRISDVGGNVFRFDYFGAGISEGEYKYNTFEEFVKILDYVIDYLKKTFSYLNKVVLIGFSEGIKLCTKLIFIRNDIKAICSCNGLLVTEEIYNTIERPKMIDGDIVYNSYYGVWINFDIVKQYNNFLFDNKEFPDDIDVLGVYSEFDQFTKKSVQYFRDNGLKIAIIKEADHLFTKYVWKQEMFKVVVNWTHNYIMHSNIYKLPFFLSATRGNIFMSLNLVNNSSDLVLFVHGIGQNKSGPGFLFNQISQMITMRHNYCLFDFHGCGDSEGDIKDIDLDLLGDNLESVISFIKDNMNLQRVILIGSGLGNHIITRLNTDCEIIPIFLYPQKIDIFSKISNTSTQFIDTSDLYDKDPNIETEFCKIGNVYNRTKGMLLSIDFLKSISNIDIFNNLNKFDKGLVITNINSFECNLDVIYFDDNTGLLMNAKKRDSINKKIVEFIEEVTK